MSYLLTGAPEEGLAVSGERESVGGVGEGPGKARLPGSGEVGCGLDGVGIARATVQGEVDLAGNATTGFEEGLRAEEEDAAVESAGALNGLVVGANACQVQNAQRDNGRVSGG